MDECRMNIKCETETAGCVWLDSMKKSRCVRNTRCADWAGGRGGSIQKVRQYDLDTGTDR